MQVGPTAELFGVYGWYHINIFESNMVKFLQYLDLKLRVFQTNDTRFKHVQQLFRIVDCYNTRLYNGHVMLGFERVYA